MMEEKNTGSPEIHPFELIVGDETGEIHNGDVAVRWCVTPELVKKMEDAEIVDPHVLLVTATPSGQEMHRQIVPMTELMTFVRFTRSGPQELYGFILDGVEGRKELHKCYTRKRGGDYNTEVVTYQYDNHFDDLPFLFAMTSLTVHIPEGVFGKEPSTWMKWFANFWHSSDKVSDECHYRQRWLLAFTLKWPFLLTWVIIQVVVRATITGGLILCGYKKDIHFLRSFRPYKYPSLSFNLLNDGEIDFKKNYMLFRWKYHPNKNNPEQYKMQPILSGLAFTPLLLIIQASVIWYNAEYFVETMLQTTGILLGILVIADIIVFTALMLMKQSEFFSNIVDFIGQGVIDGVKYVIDEKHFKYFIWLSYALVLGAVSIMAYAFMAGGWVIIPFVVFLILVAEFGNRVLDWLEIKYSVAPDKNDCAEIRELLCPKDALNLRADVHFIPPKQRTIRLWYLDLKNKICKPMQS